VLGIRITGVIVLGYGTVWVVAQAQACPEKAEMDDK
jgi:hypothetical protein